MEWDFSFVKSIFQYSFYGVSKKFQKCYTGCIIDFWAQFDLLLTSFATSRPQRVRFYYSFKWKGKYVMGSWSTILLKRHLHVVCNFCATERWISKQNEMITTLWLWFDKARKTLLQHLHESTNNPEQRTFDLNWYSVPKPIALQQYLNPPICLR